jgi:hypothetical protein
VTDGGRDLQRWVALAVVLLVVGSVVGLVITGGEADDPTHAEFAATGNKACDRMNARALELSKLPEKRAQDQLPGLFANLRRSLEAVGAPAGERAAFDNLVGALHSIEVDSRQLAANPEADDVGGASIATAASRIRELGLDRCLVFAGMQRRAEDRVIQSFLRNAFAAEKVYFTDSEVYTESLADLRAIEPALTYVVGTQVAEERTVYVKVIGSVLYLSGRSTSGTCFFLRDGGPSGAVQFGVDPGCGPAEGQQYRASW